jgi:hypothetical protein
MFKGSHYFDVRHDKPWWWYRSCFPVRRRGTLTGEASPYYLFHPLAPERIADALPAARFIVVLREPVDRAYSQWLFEARSGHEDLDFRSAVMREPERVAGEVERMRADRGYESAELRHHAYLARSRYAEQLRRLYSLVSPERVLVLQTERMSADPGAEMARAWDFLGLPRWEPSPLRLDAAPPSAPLSDELRAEVMPLLEDDVRQLTTLPGVDVSWPRWQSLTTAR